MVFSYLNTHANQRVMIEGHTDSKGSDNYNLYLSKARADKIKEILNVMGIENTRLVPNGFGESRPLVPNSNPDGTDNPENRQRNRRVEFKIIKED